jgi:tetratricopeptide (TPR) repeat protein
MALKDVRGLAVSTGSQAALDKYEAAATLLNGYFADPLAAIDAALAEDPRFVLAHCFRAALFMLSTERPAEAELRGSLAAAEALADKANERERGHIAALRSWLAGDFEQTAWLYERVLTEHPRDLLALQLAHQCDFFMGLSSQLRDRVARALHGWREDVPGIGYVLGMHAFGLEEMGDYARAEEQGRRALELNRRDPWAVHAVAHVMEMQGRIGEGIGWLTERSADWAPDNMFAFHNWWHLALYHLDLDQHDRVLQLYDEAIRPKPSGVSLEMVDAAALLWRLHLRGVDAGKRWQELADAYEPTAEHAYYAFNDAHAMAAFVGAGRDKAAAALLAALERRPEQGGWNAGVTRDVGLPVCRALHAFGRGDYDTTVDLLMPVRPIAHRFGGSHAQRDLLSLTLIEAALRGGRSNLAQALASERTELKGRSPFNWAATARALDLAGDAAGAAVARTKAGKLRSSALRQSEAMAA